MYCCHPSSPLPQPIKLSPLEEIRFEAEEPCFLYLEDALFCDFHRNGELKRFDPKDESVSDVFSFPAPVKALKWDHLEKKMLVNTARNCFVFYLDGRCYSLPFFGLRHFSVVSGTVVAIVADESGQTLFLSSREEYLNLGLVYRSREPGELAHTLDSRSLAQLYMIDHNKLLRVELAARAVSEIYTSAQRLNSVFFEHQQRELYCSKFDEATVTVYSTAPLKNLFNWRLGGAQPLDAVVTEIGGVFVLTILCVNDMNLSVILANARSRTLLFNLTIGAADPKARLDFLDFNLLIRSRNKLFNFTNIKDSFADTRTIELSSFTTRTSRIVVPERSTHAIDAPKPPARDLLQVHHFEHVLRAEAPIAHCFRCFARPRRVRFDPCRHILLCRVCFQSPLIPKDSCYFCGNPIQSTNFDSLSD